MTQFGSTANLARLTVSAKVGNDGMGTRYPRLTSGDISDSIIVKLSFETAIVFPSLAEYDAWCEELDRQRAALGVQQTFGDAA